MVEHLVWDQGVAGSNPVFPTSKFRWGLSSAGRAPALHAGGQRFDPARLHHMEEYPSPAEGIGLENRQGCNSPRGFESLFLRHSVSFILSRGGARPNKLRSCTSVYQSRGILINQSEIGTVNFLFITSRRDYIHFYYRGVEQSGSSSGS